MHEIKSLKDVWNLLLRERMFLFISCVVIFLAYVNITRGDFVSADDIPGIVESPTIHDLKAAWETKAFLVINNAVIYALFGLNAGVYHLRSVLLHLVNFLIFFILASCLFDKKVAKVAALLYALHPVNTEAILWISAHGYQIDASTSLIALLFFVLFRRSKNIKYLIVSVGVFIFQTLTARNSWGFVVPLLIVTVDQFFIEKSIQWKNLRFYIPYLLVSAAFMTWYLNTNYENRLKNLKEQYYFDVNDAPPLLNRAPFTIGAGTGMLLFPKGLCIYPGESPLGDWEYKLMILATLSILGTVLYCWRKNRIYTGLIVAVIFSVAPAFSPVQVAWLIAERYLYLGSAFFAVIVALLITKIKDETLLKFALALLFLAAIIRIIFRTEDWRTNKNLWLSTRDVSPFSYRVYNNLGDVYMKEGNTEEAIKNFRKSFEIYPGYADAIHNLGFTYMSIKDFANAKKYLMYSYKVNPRIYPALEKLGIIAVEEKDYALARVYFNEVLKIMPDSGIAKKGLETLEGL